MVDVVRVAKAEGVANNLNDIHSTYPISLSSLLVWPKCMNPTATSLYGGVGWRSFLHLWGNIQVVSMLLLFHCLQKVTVKEGHATYEQLENPSIPIYKDFYFFNLTNAVEFAESYGEATPELVEIGPYSYR